jgi:tetratricopeptide (TPR) repeat protein
MNMTKEDFFRQLEQIYKEGMQQDVEAFLNQCLRDTAHGCSICFNPVEISVCNEFGVFYRSIKEFRKAKEMFEAAKNLIEMHLGKKTIQYAAVMNNLSMVCQDTGQYAQAEDLRAEAARLFEVLGEERNV